MHWRQVQTPAELLRSACSLLLSKNISAMLQCSITDEEQPVLIAQRNGFVHSVLNAYGEHHHLVIRYVCRITYRKVTLTSRTQPRRCVDSHPHTTELLVGYGSRMHSFDVCLWG